MPKTLILVRHAHRDTSGGRLDDNGLSDKGKQQAQVFREQWVSKLLKASSVSLLSSPKLRCIETVEPLAEALKSEIEICEALDEQLVDEDEKDFESRLNSFLRSWKKSKTEFRIACSHGDVIPLLCKLHLGKSHDLKKGEWIELV